MTVAKTSYFDINKLSNIRQIPSFKFPGIED